MKRVGKRGWIACGLAIVAVHVFVLFVAARVVLSLAASSVLLL